MKNSDINITIGSDPEFLILCGDYVEVAGEVLSSISGYEFCGECNACTECGVCEYEAYINISDVEGISKVVNEVVDEEIRAVDMIFFEGEKMKKYVLPYLNAEKLKNELINDIIEGYTRIDSLTDIYFRLKESIYMEKIEAESEELITAYYTAYYHYGDVFINDVINKIYDKIEIPEEEPVCRYDTAQCGICTNCSRCGPEQFAKPEVEIGCDEQIAIGEIRPAYKINPLKHFEEIEMLINDLFDMLSSRGVCGRGENDLYQIRAGSYHIDKDNKEYRMGGHIHIGYPPEYLELLPLSTLEEIYNMNAHIGNYISYYSGLLLKRIEIDEEREKREMHYGKFGESRDKDYGIEWRMPASWLVSPEICKAALCLTYVVAYEFWWLYYNNKELLDAQLEVIKNIGMERLEDIYSRYIGIRVVDYYINYIINSVSNMKLFKEYEDHIVELFDMVLSGEKWKSDENIFENWIAASKYEEALALVPVKV